ncbi:hypothetical protein [Desulfurobacterium crinifex]
MKRVLLLLANIFLVFSMALADTSPLGLILGKTTIKELKAKYRVKPVKLDEYSDETVFSIDPEQTSIEELSKAHAIFDKKGKLVSIDLLFPKYKFDEVTLVLSRKYKSLAPIDKWFYTARFESSDSLILIEREGILYIKVTYITKDFWKKKNKQIEREKKKKFKRLEGNP